MEDSKTIALLRPVTLGEQEISELHLVEPTAGQIEKALKEPSQTTANIVLIADIAKVPPAAVRLLALRDFNACVDFLQGFTKAEASGE